MGGGDGRGRESGGWLVLHVDLGGVTWGRMWREASVAGGAGGVSGVEGVVWIVYLVCMWRVVEGVGVCVLGVKCLFACVQFMCVRVFVCAILCFIRVYLCSVCMTINFCECIFVLFVCL